MKLLSYKVLGVDEKGVKVEVTFDTEKKVKVIQATHSTRDKVVLNSDGSPVLNDRGLPVVELEKFRLYDPSNPDTVDTAVREWASAYIRGKEQEQAALEARKPSDALKKLIGKKVEAQADPA